MRVIINSSQYSVKIFDIFQLTDQTVIDMQVLTNIDEIIIGHARDKIGYDIVRLGNYSALCFTMIAVA